jgi:hypothetical protein
MIRTVGRDDIAPDSLRLTGQFELGLELRLSIDLNRLDREERTLHRLFRKCYRGDRTPELSARLAISIAAHW